MKKILLSVVTLFATFTINAQDLVNQKFDDLTLGDLSQDLTGATAGKGGWYVDTGDATALTSDFGIINVGTNDNALLLITEKVPTTSGATVRWVSQKMADSWLDRTAGNDKLVCTYEFFTGTATANTNANLNARLYNDAGYLIGGFTYNNVTRAIRAQALRNTSTGTATGTFYLGGAADLVLTADSWYKMILVFDSVTGDVYFTGNPPGLSPLKITGGTAVDQGANAGKDVGDFSIYTYAGTGNADSEGFVVDNVFARAQTDLNLSVESNVIASKFSISPNPANDVVSVSNGDSMFVNEISITDLNGRTVKKVSFDNVAIAQVNVSDLASGMYIMNVTSDKGTATKKFVKR